MPSSSYLVLRQAFDVGEHQTQRFLRRQNLPRLPHPKPRHAPLPLLYHASAQGSGRRGRGDGLRGRVEKGEAQQRLHAQHR